MKNLILLNRLGFNPDLTTRQSRVDSVSIASRYRVLATLLLCLTLFVGSGNVWGEAVTLTYAYNSNYNDMWYGNMSDASSYWKLTNGTSVFSVPISQQPTSNITITISIAYFGSGTEGLEKISASGTESSSNWTLAETTPTTHSGSTYASRSFTITKNANPTTLAGLDITFKTNNGKALRVNSIQVSYTAASCTAPNHVDISGRWDRFGGETISLKATAYSSAGTGSPITSGITGYQWQKYYNSTWNDIAGATSATYTKTNCSKDDSGSYRCQVSTGATCTTASDGFQVKVYVLECYTGGTTIYNFTRIGDTQAGTCQITLAAGNHTFKFHADNDYYGNNGTINEDVSNWVCSTSQGNLTIAAGLGGTFTINMEYSTSGNSSVLGEPEISVTYPRKTIYLNPGVWNVDGAKFAIYYYGVSGTGWTDFIAADACGMSADIPQWNGVKMDVVRLKNTCTSPNWGDKWAQTNDITVSSNDYVTITGWNESDYTYTTYSVPTYTITFAGNGNTSGSMTNVTGIPCGEDRTLAANAFVKTGHTFNKWKTDVAITVGGAAVAANGLVNNKATINNITSNITLTAQWNVNNYNLTWNLGGGTTTSAGTGIASGVSANTTTSVAYGTSLTAPTVTKVGYTFSSWSPIVASTMPAAATTYTAQWTPNEYTVTWKVNGSNYSEGGSTSVNHGSKVTTLPTAPDPGDYCGDVFVGWTDATDGAYVYGTSNLYKTASEFPEATGNQIFYAVFADYAE